MMLVMKTLINKTLEVAGISAAVVIGGAVVLLSVYQSVMMGVSFVQSIINLF